MKPLKEMNNVDKAQLLHLLFPDEILPFIDYVKQVCLTLQENESEKSDHPGHHGVDHNLWMLLINNTIFRINRHREQMLSKPRVFARYLYDGQNVMLMQYCFNLYTDVRRHKNQMFTDWVKLLFKTETLYSHAV